MRHWSMLGLFVGMPIFAACSGLSESEAESNSAYANDPIEMDRQSAVVEFQIESSDELIATAPKVMGLAVTDRAILTTASALFGHIDGWRSEPHAESDLDEQFEGKYRANPAAPLDRTPRVDMHSPNCTRGLICDGYESLKKKVDEIRKNRAVGQQNIFGRLRISRDTSNPENAGCNHLEQSFDVSAVVMQDWREWDIPPGAKNTKLYDFEATNREAYLKIYKQEIEYRAGRNSGYFDYSRPVLHGLQIEPLVLVTLNKHVPGMPAKVTSGAAECSFVRPYTFSDMNSYWPTFLEFSQIGVRDGHLVDSGRRHEYFTVIDDRNQRQISNEAVKTKFRFDIPCASIRANGQGWSLPAGAPLVAAFEYSGLAVHGCQSDEGTAQVRLFSSTDQYWVTGAIGGTLGASKAPREWKHLLDIANKMDIPTLRFL